MTAHAQLAGPIRRPGTRRPAPHGSRVRRTIVGLVVLAAVVWTSYALITSPRVAQAAQSVCNSATHAGTPDDRGGNCAAALYDYGFPE